LIPALRTNPLGYVPGLAWALLCFVAVALLRLPLAAVLLGMGGLSSVWAWRQLAKIEQHPGPPA
jgi:chromate transporter